MSKKAYENIKDILCNELDEISHKSDINREILDDIYKLTSSIVMIDSLLKKRHRRDDMDDDYMNEGDYYADTRGVHSSYDGMSNRMGYPNYPINRIYHSNRVEPHSEEYSRDYEKMYDEYSDARGRDARTGRYVSRDNDPEHDKWEVANRLEEMRNSAKDQHTRDTLTQALNMLK